MSSIPVDVSVKAVRGVLPAESRERSLTIGVLHFAVTAAVYWVSFAMIAVVSSWWLRVVVAAANGLAVGMLFIVGHDACHGSLTPSSGLNRWLGRLAFLPSLHPYAAWEYSHNALHHGWTNLKGKDPVYCPRTLEEYRALSRGRQRLERFFRSWLGLLPLYLFEIWWPLEMRPNAEHRRHIDKRGTFVFDRRLVLLFPVVQTLILLLLARAAGSRDVGTILGICALGA